MLPPNIEREMETLAHEVGHALSANGRTLRDEWVKYDEIARRRGQIENDLRAESAREGWSAAKLNERRREEMQARLSDDDRERIVAEETLAWDIGRELLHELGLRDLASYDEHARRGVHNHRYRLGMDPLWPEDNET